MKTKEIRVEGFTTDTTPDDRPAMCVFGEENVGKTRFGCTMPEAVGFIALDKNTKRSIDEYRKVTKAHILVPEKPFVSDKQAIELAMWDATLKTDQDKIRKAYTEIVSKIFEFAMKLAEHKDVASVAVDGSQLFDYILFSHFGRRNQIESFQRGPANQDMVDFVNALRFKNLCLMNRAAEIWKDTGEMDAQGRKKQSPSGKFKPDGFSKIGGFMTAVIELTAKRAKDLDLDQKYRVKVVTCKGNTLMEGQDLSDYGVAGESISWGNVMTAIGLEE